MPLFVVSLLRSLMLFGGALSVAEAKIDPSSLSLSCDDILQFAFPDLCELEMSRGSLTVRGLELVYWKYSKKGVPSTGVPLLMAHGGPAAGHRYMLPLKQQACRGRDVVFWDQVGAGESSQPENVSLSAPWLMTVEYYNEEVSAIVDKMGWEKFHFLGNSWGTILGQSYAFLQDPRLQAMVLSGPLSDGQLYLQSKWDKKQGELASLPPYVQHALRELEGAGAFDSPLYHAYNDHLSSFFDTRTFPQPDCYLDEMSATSKYIYVGMQGPSEFTLGGVLRNFNSTPNLPRISNPVLLMSGRFDTMRPPVIDAMYRALPRAWRAVLPRSGHSSMIDDPRLMNDIVGDFLDGAELETLHSFAIPAEAVVDPADWPLV